MDHLPDEMTEFLIQLCGESEEMEEPPPPEEFIPLFVNRSVRLSEVKLGKVRFRDQRAWLR